MNIPFSYSQLIKQYAQSIGYDAVGICSAGPIDEAEAKHLRMWLEAGNQAEMDYLSRNIDKRIDPTLLEEGTKSIICVALNYYPGQKQPLSAPQFAYYAYGKDYHEVMKIKLNKLFEYIKENIPNTTGRLFVDTAPILEKYWATKSGIGFLGKNTMLIIPKKGSFFFLGEILLNVELDYDQPLKISCGNCNKCMQACPSNAIEKANLLNSNKCISYQTIENRGKIDPSIVPLLNKNVYGCDICQQVCPWNKFSEPHLTEEFIPSKEFLSVDFDIIRRMSEEEYKILFKGSAVKRAKYAGLMRNFRAIDRD